MSTPTRTLRVASAAGLLIAVLAIGIWAWREHAEHGEPAPTTAAQIRIRIEPELDDPSEGAASPLVTIVWFDDLSTPSCRKMSELLHAQLTRHASDLRVVWKDCPHPGARPLGMTAALIGREMFAREGNAGFFRFATRALEQLARPDATAAPSADALFELPGIASQVQHEREHLMAKVEHGMQLAQVISGGVTPLLIINGIPVQGLLNAETLQSAIDNELTAARALLARGVARNDVYRTLLADAKAAPPIAVTQRDDDDEAADEQRARERSAAEQERARAAAQRAAADPEEAAAEAEQAKAVNEHASSGVYNAETELDIAARDNEPIELSASDLRKLETANIPPEVFKQRVRIERARQKMVEAALESRTQAGVQ